MKLSIKHGIKNDVPCIAKIENECFSTPFKEEDIIAYLDNPIWHFLVAKGEGEVVGYVSFIVIIDECQIVNVATRKSWRKKGVASVLVKAMLDYAKGEGCKSAYLEVRESNLPAINLYKKIGFEISGVSKSHYSKPTENALLMNLEL